jgi:hypothetical protein
MLIKYSREWALQLNQALNHPITKEILCQTFKISFYYYCILRRKIIVYILDQDQDQTIPSRLCSAVQPNNTNENEERVCLSMLDKDDFEIHKTVNIIKKEQQPISQLNQNSLLSPIILVKNKSILSNTCTNMNPLCLTYNFKIIIPKVAKLNTIIEESEEEEEEESWPKTIYVHLKIISSFYECLNIISNELTPRYDYVLSISDPLNELTKETLDLIHDMERVVKYKWRVSSFIKHVYSDPTILHVMQLVLLIDGIKQSYTQLKAIPRILIHCQANRSHSTASAYILLRELGYTHEKSIQYILQESPFALQFNTRLMQLYHTYRCGDVQTMGEFFLSSNGR